MQKILIIVITAIFLTACPSTETVESTRISPTAIYQEYNVNASKNGTTVWATFRVGNENGKTIDLDAPSKIELNGKEMTEMAPAFMSGTAYKAEFPKVETPLQFVFTNADKKVYRNDLSFAPIEIISKNIIVSRRKPFVVKMSRAVSDNEEISLSVSGTAKDKSENSSGAEVELDSTRTTATIKSVDLKEIINGKAKISFLIRQRQSLKQATTTGGTLKFTYQSVDVPARIIN